MVIGLVNFVTINRFRSGHAGQSDAICAPKFSQLITSAVKLTYVSILAVGSVLLLSYVVWELSKLSL